MRQFYYATQLIKKKSENIEEKKLTRQVLLTIMKKWNLEKAVKALVVRLLTTGGLNGITDIIKDVAIWLIFIGIIYSNAT